MLDDAAPGWRRTIALSPEKLHTLPHSTELEHGTRVPANFREAAESVDNVGTNNDRVATGLADPRKNSLERQWQASLAILVAEVKKLGRLPTKRSVSTTWMYTQQEAFRKGRMYEGRERALNEALPGWNKHSKRRV